LLAATVRCIPPHTEAGYDKSIVELPGLVIASSGGQLFGTLCVIVSAEQPPVNPRSLDGSPSLETMFCSVVVHSAKGSSWPISA
jgi:hypothetical protein